MTIVANVNDVNDAAIVHITTSFQYFTQSCNMHDYIQHTADNHHISYDNSDQKLLLQTTMKMNRMPSSFQ